MVAGVPKVGVVVVVVEDVPRPKKDVEGVAGLLPKPDNPNTGWDAVEVASVVDVAVRELPKEKPAAVVEADVVAGEPKANVDVVLPEVFGVPNEPKVIPDGFAAA